MSFHEAEQLVTTSKEELRERYRERERGRETETDTDTNTPSVPDLPFPLNGTSPGAPSIPPPPYFCMPILSCICLGACLVLSRVPVGGPNWGDPSR